MQQASGGEIDRFYSGEQGIKRFPDELIQRGFAVAQVNYADAFLEVFQVFDRAEMVEELLLVEKRDKVRVAVARADDNGGVIGAVDLEPVVMKPESGKFNGRLAGMEAVAHALPVDRRTRRVKIDRAKAQRSLGAVGNMGEAVQDVLTDEAILRRLAELPGQELFDIFPIVEQVDQGGVAGCFDCSANGLDGLKQQAFGV